jgi:hypothetical protein
MKNAAIGVIALAALIISAFYGYNVLSQRHNASAYASALKACASKLPESDVSISQEITGTKGLLSTYTPYSYSQYPAFDRCLASKGFGE